MMVFLLKTHLFNFKFLNFVEKSPDLQEFLGGFRKVGILGILFWNLQKTYHLAFPVCLEEVDVYLKGEPDHFTQDGWMAMSVPTHMEKVL